jgi:hypothetical protein
MCGSADSASSPPLRLSHPPAEGGIDRAAHSLRHAFGGWPEIPLPLPELGVLLGRSPGFVGTRDNQIHVYLRVKQRDLCGVLPYEWHGFPVEYHYGVGIALVGEG